MLWKLFLAFTLIPVVEIYLLVKVGSFIGPAWTVLLVLASGFTGAWLARMEGLRTLQKVRSCTDRGVMPAEEILDAVIIFVAGVVLLTPGFLTDIIGLLLLIPSTRGMFKRWLRRKLESLVASNQVRVVRY
ncbi:FxsA family protein [Desulfovibrio inopinatus]|uniref:FxsA family protein n=1 Tax=Desulfovibrio inopinatus TaxID=102109 RepID=UPI000421BF97|nr:FxsA family protein [Desulfovibrio inopinatus]